MNHIPTFTEWGRALRYRWECLTFNQRVLLILAILFALFIWPTPWSHYRQGTVNVRVNRFTGTVQYLGSEGWRK